MARIRTIKPEFVESESVGKLSRDARLLFILLWTFVDDEGRARASSRLLASHLYPYDDDAGERIDTWLDELATAGHIRIYGIDGDSYLDIPKWLKHQKIDHPSKSRLPAFSGDFAKPRETFAPHTLDLGPVPRTVGPSERACADAQPRQTKAHKTKPGTRIPDGWRPSNAGRAFAADRGLDPDSTADAFVDWWSAATGSNAVKRDWDAAFRTWCRRAVESGPVGVRTARAVQPPRGNDAFYQQLADIASRDE